MPVAGYRKADRSALTGSGEAGSPEGAIDLSPMMAENEHDGGTQFSVVDEGQPWSTAAPRFAFRGTRIPPEETQPM